MQRQRNAPEHIREAARAAVSDPQKALKLLEKNITEIRNPAERYQALADEYLKSQDPKETLVLTGTHEARKAVNENIREALNLNGKGREFTRFEPGDFTEAQKKRIGCYEPGQEILFGKEYRGMGVKIGEIGKVENVDKENGTVRLKMEDGRNVTMTPRKLSGNGHEIGRRERIELSLGERIRITGNALRLDGVTNGMRGEVVEVSGSRITIRFDGGMKYGILVGKTPLEIDHGYAQTGHSAQGLGAENVILDLPSNSQTLNRRSFYTNLTRTKGQIIAYTDDRERLTGAVTREKDKTLAHDVEKEQKIERKPWEKARKTEPELEI